MLAVLFVAPAPNLFSGGRWSCLVLARVQCSVAGRGCGRAAARRAWCGAGGVGARRACMMVGALGLWLRFRLWFWVVLLRVGRSGSARWLVGKPLGALLLVVLWVGCV